MVESRPKGCSAGLPLAIDEAAWIRLEKLAEKEVRAQARRPRVKSGQSRRSACALSMEESEDIAHGAVVDAAERFVDEAGAQEVIRRSVGTRIKRIERERARASGADLDDIAGRDAEDEQSEGPADRERLKPRGEEGKRLAAALAKHETTISSAAEDGLLRAAPYRHWALGRLVNDVAASVGQALDENMLKGFLVRLSARLEGTRAETAGGIVACVLRVFGIDRSARHAMVKARPARLARLGGAPLASPQPTESPGREGGLCPLRAALARC